MKCCSILHCEEKGQTLEIQLYEKVPNALNIDFSHCQTVYEDGWYSIEIDMDLEETHAVQRINVYINGECVGEIFLTDPHSVRGVVSFLKENNPSSSTSEKGRPFLLQYDLSVLSFELVYREDLPSKIFYSNFLICMSKNPEDVENIENMIQEMMDFEDSQVWEWLFSGGEKNNSSFREGQWQNQTYKSMTSYLQLLEKIVFCYKINYSYFKSMGKHVVSKTKQLTSYDKVHSVSVNGFHWLMQHTEQLSPTSQRTGIRYIGKNYLPLQFQSEIYEKSWNVYENNVVVAFLSFVCKNAEFIFSQFKRDISSQEEVLRTLHAGVTKDYRAPIWTVKSLQVSYSKILLENLSVKLSQLNNLYQMYLCLFDFKGTPLRSFPRKTKTFQELRPYNQIFECIILWFRYGEFNLLKDRLILRVKTLDRLFEYYCLYKILQLLANKGYRKENVEKAAYNHRYLLADELYYPEREIANTFRLFKGNTHITVYYQPVISSIDFENELSLYRTTQTKYSNYYTPDFILKIENAKRVEYVIFDSKFSSQQTIRSYYLSNVLRKYSQEISILESRMSPKMVWILQGRVKSSSESVWKYHNSELARRYLPSTSYGIVAVNSMSEYLGKVWNEMCEVIPWLKL